jgi:hypothetical protein
MNQATERRTRRAKRRGQQDYTLKAVANEYADGKNSGLKVTMERWPLEEAIIDLDRENITVTLPYKGIYKKQTKADALCKVKSVFNISEKLNAESDVTSDYAQNTAKIIEWPESQICYDCQHGHFLPNLVVNNRGSYFACTRQGNCPYGNTCANIAT